VGEGWTEDGPRVGLYSTKVGRDDCQNKSKLASLLQQS
jgi:hypothetical protein